MVCYPNPYDRKRWLGYPFWDPRRFQSPPPPIPTQDASYHNHYETLFSTGIRAVHWKNPCLINESLHFSPATTKTSPSRNKKTAWALSTVCCSWASKDLTNRGSAFWRESHPTPAPLGPTGPVGRWNPKHYLVHVSQTSPQRSGRISNTNMSAWWNLKKKLFRDLS